MSTPSPGLDIVTVAAAIAAVMFRPEIAAVVGPYAVILIGAVLGGTWSASRMALQTRWGTVKYLAGIVTLALLVTVPAAEWASSHGGVEFNTALGIVAVFIGALGADGLKAVHRIVMGRVRGWLGGSSAGSSDEPPGGKP